MGQSYILISKFQGWGNFTITPELSTRVEIILNFQDRKTKDRNDPIGQVWSSCLMQLQRPDIHLNSSKSTLTHHDCLYLMKNERLSEGLVLFIAT